MKIDIPCKIGDTVWAIRNYHGTKIPKQGKVTGMFFIGEKMELCIVVQNIARGMWGRKIFATEEEAWKVITNCTDCRHFVSCESWKQTFHKLTGVPCDEFDRSE